MIIFWCSKRNDFNLIALVKHSQRKIDWFSFHLCRHKFFSQNTSVFLPFENSNKHVNFNINHIFKSTSTLAHLINSISVKRAYSIAIIVNSFWISEIFLSSKTWRCTKPYQYFIIPRFLYFYSISYWLMWWYLVIVHEGFFFSIFSLTKNCCWCFPCSC